MNTIWNSILTQAPMILWSVDHLGVLTSLEGAGLKALDVIPSDLVGHHVEEIFAVHPQFIRNIKRALQGETLTEDAEFHNQWYSTTFVPTWSEEKIVGVNALSIQVTDKKEAEARAQGNAETVLKNAIDSRDEFLSIASHELKTPLTSLMIQSQMQQRLMLRQDPKAMSEERISQMVEQTHRLTTRLNRLVDDMLDISRIRSGRLTLLKEKVNLHHVMEEALSRFHSRFLEATGQGVTYVGEDCWGEWDVMRMEQVMSNLLVNALKYGKGKPVEVYLKPFGDQAIFSIKDRGMGISEENQQKIFQRFERAVNASEISGLGLGLFIAQEIVKGHHGKLWVESVLGEGSTFFVAVPRA